MARDESMPAQEQDRQPGIEREMDPEPDYTPFYPGSGRLADQVAIVTGGDSGIGRAVAVAFAREGARVAIVYLDEHEDAEDTRLAVEAEGSEALPIAGDVGDEGFCAEAVRQTVERFGRLDILVNNAAEQHMQEDVTDISAEQLERTFRTNIFGYFFMTKAALPHLPEGGRILNTASVTAFKGNPQLIDYTATKGAIVAYTRALAQSLAERKILVNAVAPGPIWTPLIPASFPADKVAEFGKDVPLGRPGQPNEVASCFLFLASRDASYMTGQVLHPNGGSPVGG